MSEKGFTLVENVVCLVVLCAMSAFAYPEIGKWNSKYNLQSETLNLVGALHRARCAAVMRNSNVIFLYNKNGYKIFVDDGSGGGTKDDWIHQPGEAVLADVSLDKQVKIDTGESTFTLDRTGFSGKVGVKAGTVVLAGSGGLKNKIVMNVVGRVRVEKG